MERTISGDPDFYERRRLQLARRSRWRKIADWPGWKIYGLIVALAGASLLLVVLGEVWTGYGHSPLVRGIKTILQWTGALWLFLSWMIHGNDSRERSGMAQLARTCASLTLWAAGAAFGLLLLYCSLS